MHAGLQTVQGIFAQEDGEAMGKRIAEGSAKGRHPSVFIDIHSSALHTRLWVWLPSEQTGTRAFSSLSLSDMALHSLTLSSLPGASLILLVSFLLWHLRTRQACGATPPLSSPPVPHPHTHTHTHRRVCQRRRRRNTSWLSSNTLLLVSSR